MAKRAPQFSWLHLTDLHFGLEPQGWMWPTFKHLFLDDLTRLVDRAARPDLVIFSGDLVQSGQEGEFDRLCSTLTEVWTHFAGLGCKPALLCVPGNHDLVRPKASDPEAIAFGRWWDEEAVRTSFWYEADGVYRATISRAFENYDAWTSALTKAGIPLVVGSRGLLPGDISARLTVDGLGVGVVGLNSAWLQLTGGDFEGRLHVDPRQLNGVTDGDPTRWCRENDFNLLVTHHPATWLHPDSLALFHSEIDVPGRFDAHVFGHMHQPSSLTSSRSGSSLRRAFQGASLFGLERARDGEVERLHGYALGIARVANNSTELALWPRRLLKLDAGHWKLAPDPTFDLVDDTHILESYPTNAIEVAASGLTPLADAAEVATDLLKRLRLSLPPALAHANVRNVEQQQALASLQEARAIWLVSDWGMGAEGFLSAVRSMMRKDRLEIFRISLGECSGRDAFYGDVRQKYGCGFEVLCDALAEAGNSILILDEIDIQSEDFALEGDLEEIVEIIGQYCPDLMVVLKSRSTPRSEKYSVVKLRPLDEADVKSYIQSHPRGGSDFSDANSAALIFRHTDGVPSRIDDALKKLAVVSLTDLAKMDGEAVGEGGFKGVPAALSRALDDLASTADPVGQRALQLLKALSIFPRGEELSRIRRFHGVHPFHPQHAVELHDKALIDVVEGASLEGSTGSKTLVVPRPIRDLVVSGLSRNELRALNRKAADLYFGPKWVEGRIKKSLSGDIDDPFAGAEEASNASAIVVRLFRDAVSQGVQHGIDTTLTLSDAYTKILSDGGHYRGLVDFLDKIFSAAPESISRKLSYMKAQHSRALRMIGEVEEAKNTLLSIDTLALSKSVRQSALLNLALSHESLKEIKDAVEVAKVVISIDGNSFDALHAQAIILEHSPLSEARTAQLRDHEQRCREKGAHTVANNMALARVAKDDLDVDEALAILSEVIETSIRVNGPYNAARGAIQYGKISRENGRALTAVDVSRLVRSYHYLFNERMSVLFDGCHEELWNEFLDRSDTHNLLNLFRRSSLMWRLHGKEGREEGYLRQLAKRVGDAITRDVRQLGREAAYYVIRVTTLLANRG